MKNSTTFKRILQPLILAWLFLGISQVGWGQWTTVASDNFDNFPTGFSQSGFTIQSYGAETGGTSDWSAYDANVGASPTGYVSKQITLEAGYTYRFSYMAKRANAATCALTL